MLPLLPPREILHAGELWFPYPTKGEVEEIGFESIESTWQEFVEALNGENKMKNNGKWYDRTWRGRYWQLDFDLTCVGLGIGYAHGSRSFYLNIGCFLLIRGE